MKAYNLILSCENSTVVSDYEFKKDESNFYQSESQLEEEFIKILQSQAYEYLKINDEKELICNLKTQIEKLNKIEFNDQEWERFLHEKLINNNENAFEKIKKIQEKFSQQDFVFENGITKNIYLIDKKNIKNNNLQVINQYENSSSSYKNRYDVTILINGLPLVHIELKRRGVNLKEAFNQIDRYQWETFSSGSRLFQYVHIFVISNGTRTKYYSNNIKNNHLKYSFEQTSFWSDSKNNKIIDLIDFAKTFFYSHTILNIITKYCVLTEEKKLLVMRPYQIIAVEKILNKIIMANNSNKLGMVDSGGYIWHATGSGKTLTSFKAAQLICQMDFIEKTIFIVDRKDLDYQTMKEYDKFEKGAANSNSTTNILQKQLENPEVKIIITTIQKLDWFIKKNRTHYIYNKKIIMIFDECHRSQFGNMHKEIRKKFKNTCIFGFTGTPIFEKNSQNPFGTTERIFGKMLHSYTIVDAIGDKNVLKFKWSCWSNFREKNLITDEKIQKIDEERVFKDPKRIEEIIKYIIVNFDKKTRRESCLLTRTEKIRNGFNSIFAVSSIEFAKLYYLEFLKQIKNFDSDLIVTTIFSYTPNEQSTNLDSYDEDFDTNKLDKSSKRFLEDVINDYNKKFNTTYNVSGNSFPNFYKDVSQKLKNKEIDILIVVDMFLTGFDAPSLNTLWVDKNLKYHSLIQAFSRTNRIINNNKPYGDIISFRNLKENINEALSLFGNKNTKRILFIKEYEDYYNGYDENGIHYKGYFEIMNQLIEKYPSGKAPIGEISQKHFIKLFSLLLKSKNILNSFDEFDQANKISERDFQNYQSHYLDLKDVYVKKEKDNKTIINNDIEFELELISQFDINVDYILNLLNKYQDKLDKEETIPNIEKKIDSSLNLRSKKELILKFIKTINGQTDIQNSWNDFIKMESEIELLKIIEDNNLIPEKAKQYIYNCFESNNFNYYGTEIVGIMKSKSRFNKNNNFNNNKQKLINDLNSYFNKFLKNKII
ncbi:MAG: type I restriction endonuclease subunit R [Mycoplasmoidaceae bacterium]